MWQLNQKRDRSSNRSYLIVWRHRNWDLSHRSMSNMSLSSFILPLYTLRSSLRLFLDDEALHYFSVLQASFLCYRWVLIWRCGEWSDFYKMSRLYVHTSELSDWCKALVWCVCVCVCVCLSLSLCVCVCLSLSLSLSFSLSVCVCLSLSLCVCVCVSLSLSLSFSVCVCLSLSLSLSLPRCMTALFQSPSVKQWLSFSPLMMEALHQASICTLRLLVY